MYIYIYIYVYIHTYVGFTLGLQSSHLLRVFRLVSSWLIQAVSWSTEQIWLSQQTLLRAPTHSSNFLFRG